MLLPGDTLANILKYPRAFLHPTPITIRFQKSFFLILPQFWLLVRVPTARRHANKTKQRHLEAIVQTFT